MAADALVDERIVIFGGTGSLGHALVRRYGADNTLLLFSRDEAKHWTMRNQIGSNACIAFAVGDIRDASRVEEVMLRFRPTVVIIASALKHVDTCELSPFESIQTNVLGVKNVVDVVVRNADRLNELDAVLLVSTDKACAPVNVYGMCKALAERLVTSQATAFARPRFIGVRYGNVLQSRGSIVPLFRWQAANAKAFTITHPEMTRFVMTLEESTTLISAAVKRAAPGDIWIPQLRAMRISDLAAIFSERYGKPIETVGIRPGEKLHEALISEPESLRAHFNGTYFRLAPTHDTGKSEGAMFDLTSNQELYAKEALLAYLQQLKIFEQPLDEFVGRQIEEISSPA